MTTVTDPYSILADIIYDVIEAEFRPDHPKLVLKHDHLHESIGGNDGRTYVGISPDSETPNNLDLVMEVKVQFYTTWKKDIDPFQSVDPRAITNKAERLRRALREVRTVGTPGVWFLDVGRIIYPHDPTGNKTRYELTVTARGNDSGLMETTG